MNKKIVKIGLILILAVMVFLFISNNLYVNAAKIGGVDVSASTSDANGKIRSVGKNILGIIRVIGTLIAVGALMILGIKYMLGSAEEKAEYKKTMIPYVIGAVLLFAAVNLAGWIAGFAETIK